jgi:hypothetical protein
MLGVNNDIFHVVLFVTSATVAPPSLLCLSRAWRGVAKTKYCRRNKITKKFYKNSFVWARQQVVWFSCWRVFLCTPPVAAV